MNAAELEDLRSPASKLPLGVIGCHFEKDLGILVVDVETAGEHLDEFLISRFISENKNLKVGVVSTEEGPALFRNEYLTGSNLLLRDVLEVWISGS